MVSRLAPLIIVAALGATPAAGQMKPSTPEAIASATVDCWAATGAAALDEQALKAKGWKAGRIEDKKGKAAETPLGFYSKDGSNVLLMTLGEGEARGCTVMSRVRSLDDYPVLVNLLREQLKLVAPTLKASKGGTNGVVYLAERRVALLEPTGTRNAPAARIIVGYSSPEKK